MGQTLKSHALRGCRVREIIHEWAGAATRTWRHARTTHCT